MTELFIKIVNMSITASILVLLVLVMRLLFRRAPKWIHVLLWGLVAIRLICPFDMESTLSLMPRSEWIEQTPPYQAETVIPDVIDPQTIISQFPDTEISTPVMPPPEITVHRGVNLNVILPSLWVVGIAGVLVYLLISYLRIYLRIRDAVKFRDNIYTSGKISSPFVFGLFRPRICLPENMDAVDMSYVIAHEGAHIRRGDHIWKPLGFLLMTVHWFNPMIWLGYIMLCRDIESACDERVVKEYSDVQRADYSDALLACSIKRSMITACPLAFGEVSVKSRIKSVLHYKKPAFWIVVLAVIASVVAAVCFLTNPDVKRNYICRIVDDAFDTGAVEAVLDEPFLDDAVRDELLLDLVRKNYKTLSEPISIEVQFADDYLYQGKDAIVYQVRAVDSEGFACLFFAYIQPRYQTEALGKIVMEAPADQNVIASNIATDPLTYRVLAQQRDEIETMFGAAVSAEIIVEFQEKFVSAACAPYVNYVTVLVRNFSEDDILRFEKAFRQFSYVLIDAGNSTVTVTEKKQVLTLEDVITLSDKGTDLTWEDFAAYKGRDIGSGMYICRYDIDKTFYLLVGGSPPIGTPMYIRLCTNLGGIEYYIDVTKDDVGAFADAVLSPFPDSDDRDAQVNAYAYDIQSSIASSVFGDLWTSVITHLEVMNTGTVGLGSAYWLCHLQFWVTDQIDVPMYYYGPEGAYRADLYFKLNNFWDSDVDIWTRLGYITAEEFEAKYNTPEMMKAYGNPYTAAAMQSWEDNLPNK